MFFEKLFRRRPDPLDDVVTTLYSTVMGKARDPGFYTALAVPDTVNGRFDMVVIHAMLVLRRLRGEGEQADIVGKAMLELLFADMDQSLREMGVGDMGMKHHIKRMAKALFGRAEVYEAGLDGDDAALTAALKENLYRHGPVNEVQMAAMAAYVRRAWAHVAPQSAAEIIQGRIDLAVAVQP
jgi:cytochrome b pre-mRNA-processing protein 3